MFEWQKQIQIIVDEIDKCIKYNHDEVLTLKYLSHKLGYSEFHTKSAFWKPTPSRTALPISAGTRTTVIVVRTSKDPDFKPCLQTLKPGKLAQSLSRIIVR